MATATATTREMYSSSRFTQITSSTSSASAPVTTSDRYPEVNVLSLEESKTDDTNPSVPSSHPTQIPSQLGFGLGSQPQSPSASPDPTLETLSTRQYRDANYIQSLPSVAPYPIAISSWDMNLFTVELMLRHSTNTCTVTISVNQMLVCSSELLAFGLCVQNDINHNMAYGLQTLQHNLSVNNNVLLSVSSYVLQLNLDIVNHERRMMFLYCSPA